MTPGRSEMGGQQRNLEKERYWAKMIGKAARSGKSIREFCAEHNLKEHRFYSWQRTLRERRAERAMKRGSKPKGKEQTAGTFALVSDEPAQLDAGIELMLADGRRVRICRGVDEETLRTVLSAMGSGQ